MDNKTRIEKEALLWADCLPVNTIAAHTGMVKGYIAGATAEQERFEKLLGECKSMLESVVRLKHILTYEENIPPEHEGEAIAINNMFYKIENILTRIDTVTSK